VTFPAAYKPLFHNNDMIGELSFNPLLPMMRAIDKGLANSRIGLVLVPPAVLASLPGVRWPVSVRRKSHGMLRKISRDVSRKASPRVAKNLSLWLSLQFPLFGLARMRKREA